MRPVSYLLTTIHLETSHLGLQDIDLTRKLVEGAKLLDISVHDHLVITKEKLLLLC